MRFGSVCSGIEAASVAWEPLGWRADWFAEIEKFPSAVLAHHWPDVPNAGNMLRLPELVANDNLPAPDVLVGGTPCQAFSVAGRRGSLDDERGALTMAFVELADEIDRRRAAAGHDPAVVVWENVPGVLSTKDNAFGCFLAGLAGEDHPLFPAGEKWSNAGAVFGPARTVAWRILDAQYFGVAQRRRRVFVVASARDGFDPAAILFEFDGVRRDLAPRREAGQRPAPTISARPTGGGGLGTDFDIDGGLIHCADVASTLNAAFGSKQGLEDQHINSGAPLFVSVAHALRGEGFDASEDGTGRGVPTIAFSSKDYGADAQDDLAPTLRAGGHAASHANAGVPPAVTVALRGRDGGATAELGGEVATALRASTGGGDKPHVLLPMAVRRLTPRECERLQGFPDDHTLVPHRGKPAADGPRYKAIGNSMAVPVMRWIGERIAAHLQAQAQNDNEP